MAFFHNKSSSYPGSSNKDNQIYNGYVRQQCVQQSESQNKHFLAPYAMPVVSNNNQPMYNIMYGTQPIYRNQNTFPVTTSLNSFSQTVDPIPWVSESCSDLIKDNKLKESKTSCCSPLKNFYYNKNSLMDSHWFYSNYDNKKYSELPSCSQISNQCCDLNDTTKNIKSVKYCSIQKYSETDSKLLYETNDIYQQYNKITKEYSSCSQPADIQSCNLYNSVYTENVKKNMTNHYYSTIDINYPKIFDKLNDKAIEESNEDESDIVVEDSEEEVSDESEEVEKGELQCLVCHTTTSNCYVITSQSPLTLYSQTTIHEKLSNILGITKPTFSNLCNTCLNLVNTIDNLQIQLKAVQQEIISKYKPTESDNTLKTYVEKTEPHRKIRPKKHKFKSQDICGLHNFKCNVCEKIFSLKKFYLFHMAKHKTKTKYLCELCGFNFVQRSSLLTHLKRHKNCDDNSIKKSFVCHICGNLFKTKSNLKEHEHFCSGNSPFNCILCERNFPSSSKLKQHFQLKHDKNFTETCSICFRGFIKKSDLKAHLITHCSDKKFKCNKCKKTYKTLSNLNHHLKIHSEKLPFTCTICLKGFLRKENLETHFNLHNGVKPFACSICNKEFASKKNLDAHLKIHNGTATQKKCPICGKNIRHGLQDHLRTHSSVKELKCEICPMKFITKGALAKHRKRKHDSDVDIV